MFIKANQSLMLLMGDPVNKDLGFLEERKELCHYFQSSGLACELQSRCSPTRAVHSLSCSHTGFRLRGPLGCTVCALVEDTTHIVQVLGIDVSLASWRAFWEVPRSGEFCRN